MKINVFRGELTVISATKEAVTRSLSFTSIVQMLSVVRWEKVKVCVSSTNIFVEHTIHICIVCQLGSSGYEVYTARIHARTQQLRSVVASASFFAELSVSSPRKLFIFII